MNDPLILSLGGKTPRIHGSAFVAPGCRIIGDVEIGPDASIWYNCILRADVNRIVIGARTNIQDGSIVHCDSAHGDHPGYPSIIGADCLIGHMVNIHGATLEDGAFIGMNSLVLNGATIKTGGMLGAGAILTSGKIIEGGQLWVGWPAIYRRDLGEEEMENNRRGVAHYIENGRMHAAALRAS